MKSGHQKSILDADELEAKITQLKSQKSELQLEFAILNTRYEEEMKSSKEKLQVLQNAKDE